MLRRPMARIRVCNFSDIRDDRPIRVEVEGHEAIALYRVDGRYYATSNACTHMEASLAEEGQLDGLTIECTLHNCRFDIRTGEPEISLCTEPLKTYPVEVEGDDVYLTVESG
jgi:nitrite reductase/ring-hydroxylating ferredoxin subunit